MTQYLVDNSVLHGWANTKDQYHAICKNFFKEHRDDELFFPIHSLFEFQASRARKIKGNVFEGLTGSYCLKNKKFVDINRKLYDCCQKQKLFEKFITCVPVCTNRTCPALQPLTPYDVNSPSRNRIRDLVPSIIQNSRFEISNLRLFYSICSG